MESKLKTITCGCRFNRYESAEIEERVGNLLGKPMVLINSCAVTSKSEAKSRSVVRRAIRENPDATIIVSGCWAELDPSAVQKIDGVDIVLGNEEKFDGQNFIANGKRIYVGKVATAEKFIDSKASLMKGRTAAYLKIQNGCDEVCSFCVVRFARGKSRSASPKFVFKSARELIAKGAKEILLTGINIGGYGKDLPSETRLALILKELAKDKSARFRISSINPNEITDELLKVMADNDNICKHLHIPLQSGSDKILSMMKRPYTAKEYAEKVERAEKLMPNISIGCDIMAGFPSETVKDFDDSYNLLKRLPFSYAHVFSYSNRPKATAYSFKGEVETKEVKRRVVALKELAGEKNLAYKKSLLGERLSVLVEQFDKDEKLLKGKSSNFVNVRFSGEPSLKNSIVEVVARKITDNGVIGELV